MEQFPRGGGPPSNPRALACLVSRESELAFLLRSLLKRSPPPNPRALACLVPRDSELAFLLRSLIKRSPPPNGGLAFSLLLFLIVGGFYSEVALRNEKQRAQCILDTS